MTKKRKLKLEGIKVQSFLTSIEKGKVLGGEEGGLTGDCLSFIHITCPDPNCDFPSIPINECESMATNCLSCNPFITGCCNVEE